MQVWYGAKEREEKLTTKILPTLCLILHAKLNRYCLCYVPAYLQTLVNLSPAAIQRCVKILSSYKTTQWNSSRFSFFICNSLFCSLGKIFSSSLQLRCCLPWYVHIKHFLERINARIMWVAIYTMQRQSQAPWIHEGKDFPKRSWIKQTHWVKTTLCCPVTGWSDLSILLRNRVKWSQWLSFDLE